MLVATNGIIQERGRVLTQGFLNYLDSRDPASYSGSGTTWFDLSSNNLDATLVNGITYNTTTKGLILNGTNQYIQTSVNFPVPIGQDYSVFSVIKSSATPSVMAFVSNYQGTPVPFNLQASSGVYSFTVRDDSGTVFTESTGVNVSDNIQHVLCVNKNGNQYTAYIDGVPLASRTQAMGNITVTNNIALGILNLLLNQSYFNGEMYAFLLYDFSLTERQIEDNSTVLIY